MLGLRTRLSLHALNPSPVAGHPSREAIADLGLPSIAEQRKREKRERRWRRVYRVAMWTILLSAFFLAGYNTRISLTEAKHRAQVIEQMGLYRAAMLVPQGKRKCAMDWREGCLVCEHRALRGTVKSTMC
jgi:ferric-dicitrate binding protein FerR (iron transport regulator)